MDNMMKKKFNITYKNSVLQDIMEKKKNHEITKKYQFTEL